MQEPLNRSNDLHIKLLNRSNDLHIKQLKRSCVLHIKLLNRLNDLHIKPLNRSYDHIKPLIIAACHNAHVIDMGTFLTDWFSVIQWTFFM